MQFRLRSRQPRIRSIIRGLRAQGRPQRQSVAITMSESRRSRRPSRD